MTNVQNVWPEKYLCSVFRLKLCTSFSLLLGHVLFSCKCKLAACLPRTEQSLYLTVAGHWMHHWMKAKDCLLHGHTVWATASGLCWQRTSDTCVSCEAFSAALPFFMGKEPVVETSSWDVEAAGTEYLAAIGENNNFFFNPHRLLVETDPYNKRQTNKKKKNPAA